MLKYNIPPIRSFSLKKDDLTCGLAVASMFLTVIFVGGVMSNSNYQVEGMGEPDSQISNATISEFIKKGDAQANISNFGEAIIWYDKALEADPDNDCVLYAKAFALDKLGKYEEAITYFDKVLAIEPDNKDALQAKTEAASKMDK